MDNNIVSYIKENVSLIDIVSHYGVHLMNSGVRKKAKCPFHRERTASFFVFKDNNFKCFGCNKSGDVFTFVQEIEDCDFKDAIQKICEICSIDNPDSYHDNNELSKEVYKINKAFFNYALSNKDAAKDYLIERNIYDCEVGYVPNSYDIMDVLKGFSSDGIAASGLVINSRPLFHGRVMFPIYDIRGNIISFSGRSIDGALPKYLMGRNTNVFKSGDTFLGLNTFKKRSTLFLVEGPIDYCMLQRVGLNVLCNNGVSVTEGKVRFLKKYADEVVIVFDGDSAGRKGAISYAAELSKQGIYVDIVLLPNDSDPGSFRGDIAKYISENRCDFVTTVLNLAKKEKRVKDAINWLEGVVKDIKDTGLRTELIYKMAENGVDIRISPELSFKRKMSSEMIALSYVYGYLTFGEVKLSEFLYELAKRLGINGEDIDILMKIKDDKIDAETKAYLEGIEKDRYSIDSIDYYFEKELDLSILENAERLKNDPENKFYQMVHDRLLEIKSRRNVVG